MSRYKYHLIIAGILALAALGVSLCDRPAAGRVTFTDIAAGDRAGITYRRAPDPEAVAIVEALEAQSVFQRADLARMPINSRGAPGVAILDHDGDRDLDIYVTNGAGVANSLYASQLRQTGKLTFVDVAAAAGVAATDMDATGVCYGDIDNDGDPDLLVLGNRMANRLYENQGNGAFTDISARSNVGARAGTSSSCSMGDIDGDGLLDIAVAHTFDMRDQRPIFTVPFALNEPNQLLRNRGDNVFEDVSASSGILDLDLPPPAPEGAATISWTIAMVDLDLDGDVDILHGDDNGVHFDVPHGFIQIFENDGHGRFTNVRAERGLINGFDAWMGLAFADFDHNGLLDVFGTNFGNQVSPVLFGDLDYTSPEGNFESRYFLQQPDGAMADSLFLFGPRHIPFGWGTAAVDYDNDADTDVVVHGGLDQGLVIITNPGVIMANDGTGRFRRDTAALASSTEHVRRNVQGVATGDLDQNGFVDIVSVSNFDLPDATVLPLPPLGSSEFDRDAYYLKRFTPLDPSKQIFESNEFVYTGLDLPHDGTLSVEISSGGNGNRSVQVALVGTAGLTSQGRVNRDGIGAVVRFTPAHGQAVLHPVMGGSSHASQDSLIATLGLGRDEHGTIEVLWPGGVRNRLYGARAGELVRFPEIPCSYDDPDVSFPRYRGCVQTALDQLVEAAVLDWNMRPRFLSSALRAFAEARESARGARAMR